MLSYLLPRFHAAPRGLLSRPCIGQFSPIGEDYAEHCLKALSFLIRMAAAVVPVRIRRSIVHIEAESPTNGRGIVRTGPRDQGKANSRRCAPHNPITLQNPAQIHCWGKFPPTPPLAAYAAPGSSQERPQPLCQFAYDGATSTSKQKAPPMAGAMYAPAPAIR